MIPRFKPNINWNELRHIFKTTKGIVQLFEREFANYFGAKEAVAFPYGRSAQWCFFNAIGLRNTEIIMPAYTCCVIAHAVTLSGNRPVFIDITLDDFNMDLNQLEDSINEHTGAIIATHTFGYPQDIITLEKIRHEAEKKYGHKIWLMQDCCHCFGAKWNDKYVSDTGDVSVYAFNISKIITCVFGGILTFNDKVTANKVRRWRNSNYKHGRVIKNISRRMYLLFVYCLFNNFNYNVLWLLQNKTNWLNSLTIKYHMDNLIDFPPDYLDFMSDFEASIGLEQLRKYEEIIEIRKKNARWYNNNLPRRDNWILPPIVEGATYSHYTVRVTDKHSVIAEYANKGIEIGELIQYSIPHLSEYKNSGGYFPNSLLASQTSINFQVSTPIYEGKPVIF
jgi:perosamine synthetase